PAFVKLACLGSAVCLLAGCHRTSEQAATTAPETAGREQHAAPTGPGTGPAAPTTPSAAADTGATPNSVIATDAASAAPNTAPAPEAVAEASALAPVVMATADIIVGRNDTLDRIFRKLRLNLTDLANLRSMPGIRTHMDNLRLGESLHFVYHDEQ